MSDDELDIEWGHIPQDGAPDIHGALINVGMLPVSGIQEDRIQFTEWVNNGVLYNWSFWLNHNEGQLLAFRSGVKLFARTYTSEDIDEAVDDALRITQCEF